MALELYQTSSLNKTLMDSANPPLPLNKMSCLKGEEVSYQIVTRFNYDDVYKVFMSINVDSILSECITVREVGQVPCELPAYIRTPADRENDCYISTKPGLYPDPLFEIRDNTVELIPNYFRSFWITIKTDENTPVGVHPINIKFESKEFNIDSEVKFELEVIDAKLPQQELIVTQWFHSDCLADYYQCEVFSEKHWSIIEKFIKTAVENGINMILTPVFTPPLDTEVGGERPTVQLVDIFKSGDRYLFNFDKLKKWVEMCKRNGVKYYEVSHLFTQWGANFAPKIVVNENGQETKKFGWHTAADDPEYVEFLNQFLPKLRGFFEAEKVSDNVYYHISDEPHLPDKESYKRARNIVSPLLEGCKILDACSTFEFYSEKLVDIPAIVLYKIKPFIDAGVRKMWTYYCGTDCKEVSNRFIAQKSLFNRIIALQLYKYDAVGFLQWGYNFYYSQLSKELIDPFLTTDSRNAFPSGDAFSVYPGKNGVIESLRLKVFKEALQDLSALKLLEKCMPKDKIIELIEREAGCEIEFDQFPKNEEFILNLREKINLIIKESSLINC